MTQTITLKGEECRRVVHIPSPSPRHPDLHLLKTVKYYSDGSSKSLARLIKDFKQPFWITKPTYRTHKQKKEWTEERTLLKLSSTPTNLRNAVADALGKGYSRERLSELGNSPYLYGTDISSTSLIREAYLRKYPNAKGEYQGAILDFETDVFSGKQDIIIGTIAYQDHIVTRIRKDFLEGFSNQEELIDYAVKKYLPDYIDLNDYTFDVKIVEKEIEVVTELFEKLHSWRPDFLVIWNMDFDIPRIMDACKRAKIDPKDIFADPLVPEDYRYFKYKQGRKKQVTASGKVKPVKPADQWHAVLAPSSFYVVDAMCVYRRIRNQSEQELPSYSLDAILHRELGVRKLKFKEAESHEGPRWHHFMQARAKIEYVVYNQFDCVSIQLLDRKTKDLALTFPSYAGVTDMENFGLSTRRIVDELYFFCLEEGHVIASKGHEPKKEFIPLEEKKKNEDDDDQGEDEDDEDEDAVLGLKKWIITLKADLNIRPGMRCFSDDPTIASNIRPCVADSDQSSGYPSNTMVCNVSKETTKREIIAIEGFEEIDFKLQNINILSGPVNALEYCQTMFGFPTLDECLAIYLASR